jgi:LEA14-like dessication related protein
MFLWRRRAMVVAVVVVSVTVAGCKRAAQRVFKQPTVDFVGVALRGADFVGGRVEVVLRVHNPNGYTLAAERATYRLLVRDSLEAGRGEVTHRQEVAGHDSATLRLPLDVRWNALGAVGRDALLGRAVDYRVVGAIVADTPIGDYTIPVDQRGRFAARLAR